MLPSSHPSGISHSIVSSTRWRKFLWVSLYGYGSSSSAGRKRDSITVCCRFLLYDDDNSLSFLVKDKQKLFFCQDDEDDEGYFGSSLTFVGQILFCYARFVLSFAKISSLLGEGLLEKKSTQTLMNMSSKCRGISKKTQSRNSCKKERLKMTTCNLIIN